jgi:hypothetical protein
MEAVDARSKRPTWSATLVGSPSDPESLRVGVPALAEVRGAPQTLLPRHQERARAVGNRTYRPPSTQTGHMCSPFPPAMPSPGCSDPWSVAPKSSLRSPVAVSRGSREAPGWRSRPQPWPSSPTPLCAVSGSSTSLFAAPEFLAWSGSRCAGVGGQAMGVKPSRGIGSRVRVASKLVAQVGLAGWVS